ncbi:MAG: glycosyltransferase family 2 protein [Deltaproteobacteria bacterium]|nr:glycosyltransferase family 2 protein [Deltaproteobacteria bacterium]
MSNILFSSLKIINGNNIRRSLFFIKRFQFKFLLMKARDKFVESVNSNVRRSISYDGWIRKNEPSEGDLAAQKQVRFAYEPKISVIVPTFNTSRKVLVEMLESVKRQTYANWELCIADGNSGKQDVKKALDSYSSSDKRVRVRFLPVNKRIAGNTNEALALATGEFAAFLDHDDTLAPFALHEIVKTLNDNPGADFIYSDEDKISENGRIRFEPHFKPDWSPDTLRSYNYITHLTVIKKALLDSVGWFREGFDGSQDYDLILRATEKAGMVCHIPRVLYHWRVSRNSAAGNVNAKPYAFESARKALTEHLRRVGLDGTVGDGLFSNAMRVSYALKTKPEVSIIIPNRDHADTLKKCVQSILDKSTYKNYEIIVAENNSTDEKTLRLYEELEKTGRVKVAVWNKPFNYAAINNFAAWRASGEVLLFLNNDTEVISPDWLERMIEFAMRDDVGAVGAKLYYPDDTIQHAGVILGVGGIAGHSHKYFPMGSYGYIGRLCIAQNLSAVTGACLMTRKDVFNAVGGFDEGYAFAFNDVDLCMKIRDKGYLIVWTPYAELYHYESKTRGYEDTPEKQQRFETEIDLFRQRWGDYLDKGDPYYNANLTLQKEDFSLRA